MAHRIAGQHPTDHVMHVEEPDAPIAQVDVEPVVGLLEAQATEVLARREHLQHFFDRDEVGAAGEVEVLRPRVRPDQRLVERLRKLRQGRHGKQDTHHPFRGAQRGDLVFALQEQVHAATQAREQQFAEEVARVGLGAFHAQLAFDEFADPRQQMDELRLVALLILMDERVHELADHCLQVLAKGGPVGRFHHLPGFGHC
jgi:hypothetical protein